LPYFRRLVRRYTFSMTSLNKHSTRFGTFLVRDARQTGLSGI
jgi:hypothetical protein